MSSLSETEASGNATAKLPLVLDLDGTLTKTDLLYELLLDLLRKDPLFCLMVVLTAPFTSKAKTKDKIAKRASIDPAILPYRTELLDYAKQARQDGRTVVLATASHRDAAEAVAGHLGIFDEVFATEADSNLKGVAKAEKLSERYGKSGFTYAGDSSADAAVWQQAGGAILVGNARKLRRLAGDNVEAEFSDKRNVMFLILKEMRVYQWVKNILVFVPIIAAGRIDEVDLWISAALAFVCFSLMASGVYIFNDLLDLGTDRHHPRKRNRPFASGDLPIQLGLFLAPLLFTTSVALASTVGPALVGVMLAYGVLTTLYSVFLKTKPLVDVFTLACLYSVRVFGGGVATSVLPSVWLLSFSGLLFLSLAFLKRYHETRAIGSSLGESRRGYHEGETELQMQMGISSGFASAIVFAIWLESSAFSNTYSDQISLWLVAPLILLWQCRLWLAAFRNKMHDDPIVFTAKDWVSWWIFGLSALLYAVGLFGSALV